MLCHPCKSSAPHQCCVAADNATQCIESMLLCLIAFKQNPVVVVMFAKPPNCVSLLVLLLQAAAARHLVVAVDESEGSYQSVEWVLANMYRQGDMLHLMHVIPALPESLRYSPFAADAGNMLATASLPTTHNDTLQV